MVYATRSGLFSGLFNVCLLHPTSDLMLAVAIEILGGDFLITVSREELHALNSTYLLWFMAGSGGMTILLVVPMLSRA